ncbi:MAG: response regulator [Campylobacteraceae bacterium]|nr:response regulator [Campylobacteraceae bacterium]
MKNLHNFICRQQKYKILIIEDSKFFNNAATKQLEAEGHIVVQTYTLKDGIKSLKDEEFDFIILDIILPDGGGEEIIENMSENIKSKIIVLSGDEDIQRREYIFNSGVLDYISKTNLFQVIMNDIKKILCKAKRNSYINILIIDDSVFTRKMLKKLLRPKRFNVYEASNATNGLKILREKEIHLILLDYEMPDINGIQMLEKIRKHIKFINLPVIMLSGHNKQDIIARVLKHGADDFIKKPYIAEELLLKIDLHIENYIDFETLKYKEKELELSLKKAEKAEYHKSEFLANMSHEIRTPLNAILGFVEILKEENIGRKCLKYINIIDNSSQMLLGVIEDILDFSKIESGKLNIEKIDFNLKDKLNTISHLFDAQCSQKNIKLDIIFDKDLPIAINTDLLRIKQIISNLLSNAIKFTNSHKKITLKFSFKNNQLLISVRDEGIGISKDKLEHIFEPFLQEDNSTTRVYGGTGLGLTISSQLTKLLGGELSVKSVLGKGSEFYLYIPATIVEDKQETKKELANLKFCDEKILLAEDNLANQLFMKILLKKLNLTFDIVEDGVKAIEMFQLNNYNIILMDENMPNMSGMEAAKQIIEIEKQNNLEHTPIVALTANALKGDKERFLAGGMDEYLTKPINKEKLSLCLKKFLNT